VQIKDSVFIVTGASSGIGLATAAALSGRSAKVALLARSTDALKKLAQQFQVNERRACSVLRVSRATYRYRSCADPRTELRMRIRELATNGSWLGCKIVR
jgi:NADP-dependent 3-hydroxy acid dehydrogenase YdfG